MSMSQAMVEAREVTLLDIVDRAIDHGGILAGDITIAVADVDLIYLELRVLLASVERAEELGAGRQTAGGKVRRWNEEHVRLARDGRGSQCEPRAAGRPDGGVAGRPSAASVPRQAARGRAIRRKRHDE
jgi:gas vesicle structural protein